MPPKTYARRRTHNAPQDAAKSSLSSSPLQNLSPSQDLTLAEMSRRMRKRSRIALSGSGSLGSTGLNASSKNSRSAGLSVSHSSANDTVPSTPITVDHPLLPLGTQDIYDSLFETPATSSAGVSEIQEPVLDRLSPIPLARRMLSRSSSRNFKENTVRSSRSGLASPYSSRPSSRASSPFRAQKSIKRPILHVKARTLSTNLPKLKNIASKHDQHSRTNEADSILDSTCATSSPISVPLAVLHTRTSSIPVISSGLLENLNAKDWLVPPKVLCRSATTSLDNMRLDSFQAEHPSFYFNVPATASTPPRKRSTTVTQKSFHNPKDQMEYDISVPLQSASGTEDDVLLSDYSDMPRPSRRRRRTVVHMSSDSIFSSALDFSAYSSDDYLEGNPRVPVDHALSSPPNNSKDLHKVGAPLDPAFSPALTANSSSHSTMRKEDNIEDPTSTEHASSKTIPFASDQMPYSRHESPSTISPISFNSSGADANELRDIFSTLVLDDLPKPDEEIGSVTSSNQVRQGGAVDLARPTEQTHRRRRGDTIRASDFSRPSVSFVDTSTTGASASVIEPRERPTNRRARSGTVTLASVQSQPIEVMITDGNRQIRPNNRTRGCRQTSSRRAPGQATIIMKIEDEPLTPQGSDEEDDELLLTGQMWIDD